jgi:hypothetical protein
MTATKLLADNGVTSGITGYQLTGGDDGTLQLQTATAGGTATTALTINNSQNVGIGTASPTTMLQLSGSAAAGKDPTITLNNTTASTGRNYQIISGDGGPFRIQDATAAAERLRIDTSGNVGIGTSSPSAQLHVKNAGGNSISILGQYGTGTIAQIGAYSNQIDIRAYNGTNDVMTFTTGASERVRIDSSGNLLVGTTSADAKVTVYGTSTTALFTKGSSSANSTYSLICRNSSNTTTAAVRDDGYFTTGTASLSPYNYTTGFGANVYIDSSGGLLRSTSSIKYKKDVQDITHGLNDVMALRPVTYKGKSEADGDTVFGGLIAEEVHEAGLTEFVQYAEDGTPDALAYGNMVSLCIKAIQEQQTIITQLQADVASLKGN